MLAIRNIGELVVVPRGSVGGLSMRHVDRVSSAAILVDDACITWFGPDTACTSRVVPASWAGPCAHA